MKESIREQIKTYRILCVRSTHDGRQSPSLTIKESLVGADLSNLNLAGIILTEIDLRNVNFSGSDLRSACLSRSDLSGANFQNANLSTCRITQANLQNANFTNAILSYSDLTGSNLENACFDNVDMSFVYSDKNPNPSNRNFALRNRKEISIPSLKDWKDEDEQEQTEYISIFPFHVPPMEDAWNKIGKNLMTGLMAGLKPLKPLDV